MAASRLPPAPPKAILLSLRVFCVSFKPVTPWSVMWLLASDTAVIFESVKTATASGLAAKNKLPVSACFLLLAKGGSRLATRQSVCEKEELIWLITCDQPPFTRSEERRVGKEGRSRW